MSTDKSSLVYVTQPPPVQISGKAPALVFLHGRGADENDLMGLAQYFDERLYFVSVRAPYNWTHGPGFTWFDLEDIGSPDQAMYTESYARLIRFLHNAPELFPVDPTRIFLCGFSMGAIMSYAVALNEPGLVKGVMSLSGLLPKGSFKPGESTRNIDKKPFFISHGLYDSVIPVSFGRNAKNLLMEAGADVTYREYEMDHQISEETVNDMINWIANLMENKKKSER